MDYKINTLDRSRGCLLSTRWSVAITGYMETALDNQNQKPAGEPQKTKHNLNQTISDDTTPYAYFLHWKLKIYPTEISLSSLTGGKKNNGTLWIQTTDQQKCEKHSDLCMEQTEFWKLWIKYHVKMLHFLMENIYWCFFKVQTKLRWFKNYQSLNMANMCLHLLGFGNWCDLWPALNKTPVALLERFNRKMEKSTLNYLHYMWFNGQTS